MIKKIIFLIGGALGLFLFIGIFTFCRYRVEPPSYGTTLLDKNKEVFYHILSDKEEWHIDGEDEISDKLRIAVLTYEDKRFKEHCGVDFYSLGRAFVKNMFGHKKSGASTITMQVVKSLNPKKRTYINKYFEIWQALKMEKMLSKEEILRLYLNNSPYGGNIRGYETASRMYFRKPAKDLTWAQASLLAVLPNAPGMMNVEKNRKLLIKKRNYLLKKLLQEGYITDEEYKFAISEKLPKKRYSLNLGAYHFAMKLGKQYRGRTINSSLDFNLQKRIENLAVRYQKEIRSSNINDVAILVVENKTASVRAYYGSKTYYDMLEIPRAPGSTLKPILYSLAIEDGLILPESKYPDVSSYFGNFSPSNVDGKFHGMVTMEEALKNSYNLPFVYLLRDYGDDRFFCFLQSNLSKEDFQNKAGLSLILGGKEYSALELSYFYTALARAGRGKELNFLNEDLGEENRIFNEGSSILTRRSMEKVVPPLEYKTFQNREKIAWKTGTSYGRRDAWACGFNRDWTVVVWAGNTNNKGNEELRGDKTAGTLFFRVFQLLARNKNRKNDMLKARKEEESLRKIKIDKITGYRKLPDMDIPFVKVDAPKNSNLLRVSPYLKKIFINSKGEEIDSRDEDFINRKMTYVLNYPEEVKEYYKNENFYGKQVKILYPKENLHIHLIKDLGKQMEMMAKVSNPKKEELYWYINGKYLGCGKEERRKLYLGTGGYELTVVSESLEIQKIKFFID